MAGHVCSYGANGAGALAAARKERPDLVMLDIMLPDLSGFEVCRQIRRDPELYAVPVVFFSAMNSEEEIQHGLAQGADDYICKPFEMGNLLQRVERLLGNARAATKDEVTSLLSAEGVKRELQRKISRDEAFSLAYVELTDLRGFLKLAGPAGRDKAVRRLGKSLTACARTVVGEDAFIGHMGSGHFVCLFPQQGAQEFCGLIRAAWLECREELYDAVGHGAGYRESAALPGGRQGFPMLDVQCCVTSRGARSMLAAKDLFDVISKLRAKALQAAGSGTYVDMRRPGA